MNGLTTHVLDAVEGGPAAGVDVALARIRKGGSLEPVAEGTTDAEGRLVVVGDPLPLGDYSITFATGAYFASRGVKTFYPFVTVTFTVEEADRHLHVPLLLSPFAYSTYRGS